MPLATLTVSTPEESWIRTVSTAHPTATVRVLAVLADDDRGLALLDVRAREPAAVLADVEGREDVAAVDLLWSDESSTLLQVEATSPTLLSVALAAGVPLRTPFEVVDGVATWELTTTADRLSALGTRLDDAGLSYEVTSVRPDPYDPGEGFLTDRQREFLVAASELGYYDVPRTATLTEVSSTLGVSKATGSDVLHRAESAVLTWFLEEHLAGEAG